MVWPRIRRGGRQVTRQKLIDTIISASSASIAVLAVSLLMHPTVPVRKPLYAPRWLAVPPSVGCPWVDVPCFRKSLGLSR